MADQIRRLEYQIKEDTIVKDFIKKEISRHFYKYSKNINATYLINGSIAKTYYELHQGDIFVIEYPLDENKKDKYIVDKPLKILYEDDFYLVVDKEDGLLTIPSKSEIDSVFNRLLSYLKDTPYYPHILNRLDKETRGLVLVSKCRLSAVLVSDVYKKYEAITRIRLKEDKGRIELPILKGEDGIKRIISDKGVKAITNYEFKYEHDGLYHYEVILETGRTHQIRLHFSTLGSPLISDSLYGKYEDGIKLGLICNYLEFYNPFTNKKIVVKRA